jgi:hypothetical protein
VDGDKWKEKIKTGVVVDLDEWVAFTLWARTQCAKTNNECVKRK